MATVQTGIATDLITFSRTSNATVTDSDGKIKWAPHNLLLASEQFNASAWALLQGGSSLPTVVSNAAAAPNGTITADRINFGAIDAGDDYSQIEQKFTSDTAPYTFGFWIKAVAAGDVGKKVWFDLQGSTAPAAFKTIMITADWQFASTTGGLTSGVNRSATFYTQGPVYGGELQGAVSVYVWGAHLYRSDLGGMKANASAYPMYNPTTVKNLVGFSEDWSNAAWTKNAMLGFGSGSVANAVVGPNGLQTADLLVESTALSNHGVYQSAANQVSSTFSFYAKAAGRNFVALRLYTTINDWVTHVFDLSIGTRTQTSAGSASTYSAVSSSIQAANNGFYRISLSAVRASGTTFYAIDFCTSGTPTLVSATGDQSYTGDGTSGIYLWGAQLSDSASLDTYVPNYGAAPTAAAYYGPRLDADPVTLAQRGLLVEELRTNLLLYSSAFDNAAWGKTVCSVTSTTITDPSGGSAAEEITLDGGTAAKYLQQSISGVTATSTISVFVKAGTHTFVQVLNTGDGEMYANFNTSTGVVGNAGTRTAATRTVLGGGWYRLSVTFTPGTFASQFRIYAVDSNTALYAANTASTGTFYIWGAQLEAGSFATSYIPTGAATATRNADVASVSTQAFPYSASASTLVANVSALGAKTGGVLRLGPSAGVTGLLLYQNVSSWRAYVDASVVSIGTATPNTVQKMALAYNGVSNGAVLDGGSVSSVGTTVAAVAEKLEIGGLSNSADYFCGHIRQITYLPRRISNTELQTRTS